MKRTIITPKSVEAHYWSDLLSYRGLFYFMAWRDVLVRYNQTAIGIAWSILRPLISIAIFWMIGWLLKIPDQGVPRIIMVTAATLPWQFFSSAFNDASLSLVENANLLTKVYFPRIIIPVSKVIVCLLDFMISFSILIVIMVVVRYVPSWQILLLPVFLLLAIVTSLGSALLIAVLTVRYRDFRLVIPFIVQFGLYISPVAFNSNSIYDNPQIPMVLKLLYSCNPMVSVIDGFRWCITGGQMQFNAFGFCLSLLISLSLLVWGFICFRRTESHFADII